MKICTPSTVGVGTTVVVDWAAAVVGGAALVGGAVVGWAVVGATVVGVVVVVVSQPS